MLHDLLAQQKEIEDDEEPFDLGQYREVYAALASIEQKAAGSAGHAERSEASRPRPFTGGATLAHLPAEVYPGGAEITRSFAAMAAYLVCKNLTELAAAGRANTLPNQASAIRPHVMSSLAALESVSDNICAYRDSTSRTNKQAALLRATDALKALDQAVQATVIAPEQYLLRRIIRQWQALIITEGGVVGRAVQAGPVPNPYILNNPAEGERFVGRDDIMRRLEELWGHEGQVPSVVIYGHRRMGKTSILHNLGRRFGAQTVIVDFNMQRVGRLSSDADLLYQLALHIYDEYQAQGFAGLDEPAEQEFPAERAYLGFTRFLKRLDGVRAGRRLIITIDEFEKIEAQMEEGRLTPELLDFWRGTFTTFPWLVLAFAGLYSLEERRHDYWNPLFGSVTGIPVSFLTPGAARLLITEPSPDFALDYDEAAIDRIVALTNGQPFLVQLIGHTLVTRFNQRTYEQGREQERRFHLADVEQVIAAPEFNRDGNPYFSGVWWQAEHSAPAWSPQLAVLVALAPHPAGLTLEELGAALGQPPSDMPEALATLQRHDVVVADGPRYRFTVELMRRWVAQQHGY